MALGKLCTYNVGQKWATALNNTVLYPDLFGAGATNSWN